MLKNFFFITIVIFVAIYLRWFWLTPLVFEHYNDPNAAFLVGLTLFIVFLVFTIFFRLLKHDFLKYFILALTVILAVINISHIFAFFPLIENRINCNGRIYYITWMHPFGDYQWNFDQLTIWEGLHYESHFFGYSRGPFEIVCDKDKENANIIRKINGVLTYSHGENSQNFDDYAGTEFSGHKYFLSSKCNNWHGYTCPAETYTLYECNLDYKSCDSLYISYTDDNMEYLVLEASQETGEISLYDDYDDNPDRALIFTYGKNPRCYVKGCEILENSIK